MLCFTQCLVTQSCLTLCDSMDCSLPGSSVHSDSPGKNTGMGCHAFFQGIFPIQGSNPCVPYYRWILYCLSHQVSANSVTRLKLQLAIYFLLFYHPLSHLTLPLTLPIYHVIHIFFSFCKQLQILFEKMLGIS